MLAGYMVEPFTLANILCIISLNILHTRYYSSRHPALDFLIHFDKLVSVLLPCLLYHQEHARFY